MPTLKDVELKIAAVKKTKQITKAMNMVATSRLRGAQSSMESFRPYAAKFAEVLGSISGKAGDQTNPLLVPREDVKKIHIMLCTSDRGLCGGFNTNLIHKASNFIQTCSRDDVEFSFTNFGKKGRDWCRKQRYAIVSEHLGVIGSHFNFSLAATSGRAMVDQFLNESYDEVHMIFAHFKTMARQEPTVIQLLPIPAMETIDEVDSSEPKTYMAEHICEPNPQELLNEMLPRNIGVQIFNALLETSTSEHAARMLAMDNATKACNDMIESLTLAYNKARQAAITAELMDIVGGAEALKG
jgi:F-type H+-transporting ATPase subunit gamma